jgi:hypothetical protein
MQYRDGHISTCIYIVHVPVVYSLLLLVIYLFVLRYLLLLFIYFVHCSTIIRFVVRFPFPSILLLLFIVRCSKEKSAILI